jgi:hypothetical protein
MNQNKANRSYLVFPSSFFSIGASAPGAPAFPSGPAAPGCPSGPAGAGAAGAGGGGGGFTTVSSFLLQPAKVRVKAKSVTFNNKTIFFPILSSPPFPLFRSLKPVARSSDPYLVFDSSFFSGTGAASFIGSPGFVSPMGAAGSAGAVGAGAGGGGGGAGSSFLPHPTNVRVNAKSVIADNVTSFFPILIHLLSRHTCKMFFSLKHFVSHKSEGVSSASPAKMISPRRDFFLDSAG